MDIVEVVLPIILVAISVSLILYHFYSYAKAKKANRTEVKQILMFNEEDVSPSEEISFHFEKVPDDKESKEKASRQIQIPGSIRLAAGISFDYEKFVAVKNEEFKHNLFAEYLGIK